MTTIAERRAVAASRMRAYRRTHPEYIERAKRKRAARREIESAQIQLRRHDPRGWVLHVLRNIRHRAKRRGLDCSISLNDLVIPAMCPVLGIPIVIGNGWVSRAMPNSPSVDRIDNSKGYVPGNVRIISLRANQLKSDATLIELKALVSYMEREAVF